MTAPNNANVLPSQTPNSSAPIAQANVDAQADGPLLDSLGKPVTGTLSVMSSVTSAWRYLFGTFVQRSSTVSPSFTLTASAGYSQSQMQSLIDQVAALSAAVGKSS